MRAKQTRSASPQTTSDGTSSRRLASDPCSISLISPQTEHQHGAMTAELTPPQSFTSHTSCIVRVLHLNESVLCDNFGTIKPGDETLTGLSARGSAGYHLAMRDVTWLLMLLRLKVGIPPENALYIRQPAFERWIFVPAVPPCTVSQQIPSLSDAATHYRLELQINGSITSLDIHEQPPRAALSSPDDTSESK